jgi:hypothetical protein
MIKITHGTILTIMKYFINFFFLLFLIRQQTFFENFNILHFLKKFENKKIKYIIKSSLRHESYKRIIKYYLNKTIKEKKKIYNQYQNIKLI